MKKEKESKTSAKRIEIEKFKEGLKHMTYTELNSEAIRIAFKLMDTNPNTWKKELATNRKHEAILELMKEKQL